MTLNDVEQYELAEEFLIEQNILESRLNTEQYDVDPFKYFAEEYEGNQLSYFRPSVIRQIEEAEERVEMENEEYGVLFDHDLEGILTKGDYARSLSRLEDLFEGFNQWGGQNTDSSQYNNHQDIDYDNLVDLGKIAFTASQISSYINRDLDGSRPVKERDSLGDMEEKIYLSVREEFGDFQEGKDFVFTDYGYGGKIN